MENKKAYVWAMAGQFAPQAISLVTNMVLARFLLPAEFGKIAVLNVFLSVASVLMDSGLGGSLVKEKIITKNDCSTIFVFNLSVSLILYLALFFLSGFVENFYGIEGLKNINRLLCLCFVINSFGLVPRALLMRNVDFRTISQINIISFLIASITAIIVGVICRNVYALLINQLLNSLLQVILVIYKSRFKFSFYFSLSSFKKLIPFGLFTTMTSVIDTIYENIITLVYGKSYSIQQAAYVSQAKKIEDLSSRSVAQTVSNVAFPVLAKYRDDKERFTKESNRIFMTFSSLIIPLLLVIAVFADEIIQILFGAQWFQAADYLRILMFAGIFILCESLNRTFIKSLTIVDELFRITVFKRVLGILLIVVTALIVPGYLLYAYVISSMLAFLFNNYLCAKSLEVSFWKQIVVLLKVLLPNIGYYLLLINVESLLARIVITMFYLLSYYLLFFLLSGVKINTVIKR